MTDAKLTDEQLNWLSLGYTFANGPMPSIADVSAELLALRADKARLEAALGSVRKTIWDCKWNAAFSSKEAIVRSVYDLLPSIDAALAQWDGPRREG